MAKKSKIFSEIQSLQNDELLEQNMLNKLEDKVQKSSIGRTFSGMVTNPKGEVKMSEVLEDFISPYLELVHNYSEQESLVGIAIMAWNLSLVPESN